MVLDFSPIKNAFAFPALDEIFGFEVLQKYSAKIDLDLLFFLLLLGFTFFSPRGTTIGVTLPLAMSHRLNR